MIVGFLNDKGGTGKTTTAVHFFDWLLTVKQKSVILIDGDGWQQSSSRWLRQMGCPSQVISSPETILEELPKIHEDYEWVVVDAPATLGNVSRSIIAVSDRIVIPCPPTPLDLHGTGKVLAAISEASRVQIKSGTFAGLFLNRAFKNTVLFRESLSFIEQYSTQGYHVLPPIFHRQAITDSPGQGSTVFRAKSAKDSASSYEELFSAVIGEW